MLSLALLSLTAAACTEAAEEAPPITYEEDEKADSAFEENLEGTRNEWGEIIRPDEAVTFTALALKINELQRTLAPNGTPVRGFHAKMHGCMKAELQLDPDRPALVRHGLFADDELTKQAWVRLSNGQGKSLKDNERDVRGIAIKVMGVDGPRLIEDGSTTQDFLMTTRPASHVNDAIEFMEFAEAAATGGLLGWGLRHPVSAARLFRQTAPVKTLVTKYWSGAPYRVGPSVAKFAVWPCDGQSANTLATTSEDPDFLRQDLEHRLAHGGVCYVFGVQLRKDPANEKVEKASSVWDEGRNPFIPVAKLVVSQRTADEARADAEYCDDMAFNPWNGLEEHQPLGHMNRARRLVYKSSAEFRGHVGEPAAQ